MQPFENYFLSEAFSLKHAYVESRLLILLRQLLVSSGMTPYLLMESAFDFDKMDLEPIRLAAEPGFMGFVSPARQSTANLKSSHIS